MTADELIVQLAQWAQTLIMSAALLLLWSVRHAFASGKWATTLEGRVTAVEERGARLEKLLEEARRRSSEKESDTQTKVNLLELSLITLKTEISMRVESSEKNHERFEREFSAIWKRLNAGAK